jgi:hypothetical protein
MDIRQILKAFFFTVALYVLQIPVLQAQDKPDQPNLRWNLAKDTSSFAGIIVVNQIWTRYIENNPDINGVAQYPDFDLGIRRSRLIFYTYLMDKVFIYTQIGADDLTYRSGENPGIKIYNAETEYIFKKDKLHIGFGLNTWNGVSRYTNSKFLEFLVIDNPGFVYPLDGTFDLAGRQFGIYAKGTLNKLHYRVSVVKPFETGIDSISSPVTTERINENLAFKGYFSWQFFDKENTLFPYMTMNNLGRAKVFNIGAGFYYHPEAMLVEAEKDLSTVDPYIVVWLISQGQIDLLPNFADYGPSKYSDIFLASVDAFLDMPTKNKGAVTSYLGYYYYFFGPNYLHSMGKMNVSKMAIENALLQGAGNSEWEVGTGHIVRGEFGYLLPRKILNSQFQPYGAFTWKNFHALDQSSLQFDAGVNWLIHGHNMKWTVQYSTRPIYNFVDEKNIISEYKGQIILQTQICF